MASRTERILIIDSDEKARAELDRYLESRGFTSAVVLTSARRLPCLMTRPPTSFLPISRQLLSPT